VGFIKKMMKLMQNEHPMMSKIEVQLTQEKEMETLPNRPSECAWKVFTFRCLSVFLASNSFV